MLIFMLQLELKHKNSLRENSGKWLTSESNQLKLAYHKIRSLELQFD